MISALLRLMRLYYALPLAGGFVVIASYFTGGHLAAISGKAVFAFLALCSIIAAGYVLNDVCDVEIDRINCPRRMLPAGAIPRNTALIWAMVLFAAGLAWAIPCGLPFVLGIAAIASLLVVYNLLSKRLGVWKDILVAVLATSLYPLVWTLTTPTQTPRLPVLFIHPVWLFLSCLGYEMLKDIRDVKGDQTISGDAYAHRKGKGFLLAARVILVAGSIVTLLPYFLGYCRQIYLAASIGAVVLAFGSTRRRPTAAIRCIYAEIFLISAGSLADLLVFGP